MTRINYQSDFTLRVSLKSGAGTQFAPPVDHPWWLHITDSAGTCWRCGFDGVKYEDCSIDDMDVICYVNNPGFVPGMLSVTYMDTIPDSNFADGYDNVVQPASEDLVLWEGATTMDTVEVSLILSVIAPRVINAAVDHNGDLNLTFNT